MSTPRWLGRWCSVAVAVALLAPIVWLSVSAFRPEADILNSPYEVPERWTLANLAELARLPGFSRSVRNSLVVALGTAAASTILGLGLGYLLCRYQFRGRAALRAVAFSGYLLAPAILALPYFRFYSSLGLINTAPGLILAHVTICLPLAVAVGIVAVRSVPVALEEVALLAGCSLPRRLLTVVIPASRGPVVVLFVLMFVISWKEFFFAFLLASAPQSRTLPVALALASGGESVNWGLVCALGLVLSAPAILLPFVWRFSGRPGAASGGGLKG
jgi:multiple sugar transport system permease protein